MVGSFPAVPAGERSGTGIGGRVVVGAGVVVVGVLDELPQPASPITEALSTRSDQVRTRDMNEGSFQEQAQGKPYGWSCRSDGSAWPLTTGTRGLVARTRRPTEPAVRAATAVGRPAMRHPPGTMTP